MARKEVTIPCPREFVASMLRQAMKLPDDLQVVRGYYHLEADVMVFVVSSDTYPEVQPGMNPRSETPEGHPWNRSK